MEKLNSSKGFARIIVLIAILLIIVNLMLVLWSADPVLWLKIFATWFSLLVFAIVTLQMFDL